MKQHNLIPIFGKIALSVAAALSFSTWAATYNEAPQLAELVKAGKLPTVEQRLPENPLVVEPNESIGQYGGTLNLVGTVVDNGHRIRTVAYDNLFNFDTTYSKVIPNLATGFTSNAENTEYVITLRKGVKCLMVLRLPRKTSLFISMKLWVIQNTQVTARLLYQRMMQRVQKLLIRTPSKLR